MAFDWCQSPEAAEYRSLLLNGSGELGEVLALKATDGLDRQFPELFAQRLGCLSIQLVTREAFLLAFTESDISVLVSRHHSAASVHTTSTLLTVFRCFRSFQTAPFLPQR